MLIPIVLGLGVAFWLVYRDFSGENLPQINWTWTLVAWLGVAWLMMVVRDVAYMYRLRVLTDGQLSWRKTFDVVFLWEFASAITPSVVGGSAVAVLLLNKEVYMAHIKMSL